MTTKPFSTRLTVLVFLATFAAPLAASEPPRKLPHWFDEQRVQAHFENSIQDDLAGLFQQLHPAIRSMGAEVLTRIFKTTSEGAWWPTAAGYTHEALGGRDHGRDRIPTDSGARPGGHARGVLSASVNREKRRVPG